MPSDPVNMPSLDKSKRGPMSAVKELADKAKLVEGATIVILIDRVAVLEKEVARLKRDPTPPLQGWADQVAVLEDFVRSTRAGLVNHVDEVISLKAIVDKHQDLFPILIRSIERLSKGHSAGNLGLPSKEDLGG